MNPHIRYFLALVERARHGDSDAGAEVNDIIEAFMPIWVRYVLRSGSRRSPLEREVFKIACRLSLEADAAWQDKEAFLQRVADEACDFCRAYMAPSAADDFAAGDTAAYLAEPVTHLAD